MTQTTSSPMLAAGPLAWSTEALAKAYPDITPPAWLVHAPYPATRGAMVAELSRRVGIDPDPEQLLMLDLIFAGDPETGRSAFMSITDIKARQNGKTALLAMACLGWLFLTREQKIVYSAHEAGTAAELHEFLAGLIENSPMLMKRMPKTENHGVYTANGQQRIRTASGSTLLFRTRTKGGGRGLSANKVILDEAYALTPDQIAALVPTLTAKPDPQMLFASSAGRPESSYLRTVRDQGRAGDDPKSAYVEWAAGPPEEVCDRKRLCDHRPGSPGCGMDKPEVIKAANPAYLRRITADYIVMERMGKLPTHEFGRERLGWWDAPPEGEQPIDLELWAARANRASVIGPRPYALAVEVSPEGTAALAVVGRNQDGKRHLEVIAHRPGIDWLLPAIDAAFGLKAPPVCLVLDDSGPVGSLLPDLMDRKFQKVWKADMKLKPGHRRLYVVNAREYAQSCGALVNEVTTAEVVHLDQQNLTRAVENVRTRGLADAFAWDRKEGVVDIAPLIAVTLARQGHAVFGAARKPFAGSVSTP